jgi:hypothetical protein
MVPAKKVVSKKPMTKSLVAKCTVQVEIFKLGDKKYKISVPVGLTVEECFKKAGAEVPSGHYDLRLVTISGGGMLRKPDIKETKIKVSDKIKGASKIVYIPNVRGGMETIFIHSYILIKMMRIFGVL